MTYPTNKQSAQAGISLLLAILVLAAITAVSFSLAGIIAVEIRSSGDLTRTEPILYAVQGVTEEAFFKYKRTISDGTFDLANCSPAGVCQLGNVTVSAPVARQFDVGPRVDTIRASKTLDYLLLDPTQPNNFNQAYSSFSAKYLNNGVTANVNVTVYKCCDAAGNKIVMQNAVLNSGNSPFTYIISGFGQYDVTLNNTSASGSVLVQLSAIKTSTGTDLIPLFGQQVMDIGASYLGLTRKYTVQIPLP